MKFLFVLLSLVFLAFGETVSCSDAAEPVAAFREVVKSKDIDTFSHAALRLRRWMIENDPQRPIYHFTGPESWINDPNGPIYYRGKYHLFYQFDPIVDGKRSKRCWGHAVSRDLVHWVDWPVAIWPDTRYDREGVYSGNTLIDDNGDLCALYTGNVAGHREAYGMLARSRDGGLSFEKKMVMANTQRPNKDSPVHWDGFVWKGRDAWCQLIGGTTGGEGRRGAAMLWTSPDLERWTFRRNIAPSIKRAAFWELPYLIPLGGKHVLLVGNGNPYWIGSYDEAAMVFMPDDPTPKMIDTGSYYSFNVNMVDDKGPAGTRRQLMHGWVTGPASPTKNVPYWQGAHSIPRVITLRGDRLLQHPVAEIESLRAKHFEFHDLSGPHLLEDVRGDALEIMATFDPAGGARFGFQLRVGTDGKAAVTVAFDPSSGRFDINGRKQPSYVEPGQFVTMRVFLDRSIVEVYVNGCAQTARVFAPPDALGLKVFPLGEDAKLKSLSVWKMKSIWE